MSYRGRKKANYGNQKRSKGFWRFGRKGNKQEEKEVIYVKDDDSDKPKMSIPDVITWTERPIPPGVKVVLSRPTSLTAEGAKVLLPNDLLQQQQLGYEIAKLATENKKLCIEVMLPNDPAIRKFRIIKSVDQLPTDHAVSLENMQFVGNLRNQLRQNGFTLLQDG